LPYKFVEEYGFRLEKLDRPVEVKNIDGTSNSRENITYELECNVFHREHHERLRMDICNLGRTKIILGMPWLAAHNPEINWETGEVKMSRCPPWCSKQMTIKQREAKVEDGKDLRWTMEDRERKKEVMEDRRKVEDMVPKRFHKWLKVFGKQESERMPVHKTWDYAIDLQEEFVPRKGRIYPLSRIEREKVQAFVDSQLKKGYIWLSKSPQTSPVMFVPKKDGKRRIVQDYQYINKFTVKNSYPLPLISDLVDNMGTKRVSTKMDLRWGYNNVRIKEGDEWKAAFTTHIGSFEPVVMFSSLTNLPATFQTMMNDIFRDLINKGDVATFIDDVLVGIETEKEHNELVKEILRRLEEHNLYVKPEKCEWKVREVGFLGVVIGPDRIKMEKEKVRGVLEWPTPKCVKDVITPASKILVK